MNEAPATDRTLVDLVRRVDHDRFLCALFAPRERQAALFALIAFNHEIARVRETVSEPLLGQIRLQWWREAIAGIYDGAPRRHEVIEPLMAAIRGHGLSRGYFDALIDARARDLDDTPPADMAELIAYAEGTTTPFSALMAKVIGAGGSAESLAAARHAALAFALVGLVRAVPFHASQSRLYLPVDRLAAHGLRPTDVLGGRFSPPLGAAIGEVLDHANEHCLAARDATSRVPRTARVSLLPVTLAAMYAARLRALGNDPYDSRLVIGPLKRQLLLSVAHFSGRF
ncbi:MAG: squalene/phytoene synthase family protein [Alphaproteobacteria bacterium]|nr:squalene/phytoene synthase family protein [Alphaproteobacteria bacterium]